MRLKKLNELSDSDGRLIVAVLCIIGALAMHSWLVNPHLACLRAAQRYERAVAAATEQSKSMGLQLRGQRLELDRLRTERTELAEAIFPPEEVEPFFGDFHRLCTENQCTVLSFGYEEKNTSARRLPVDPNVPVVQKTAKLTLQADYGNFVRLINTLQTYPRKVWIDTLKIAVPPTGSGVACDLEISINVFRSKESESHD
jgi:hypothetical protein